MSSKKHMLQAAAGNAGSDSYWIALLGGASNDSTNYGGTVAVDSSGNIIVAGQTQSGGAGSADCLIAKYNDIGELQWARTLGGGFYDGANALAVDSSDNIIIAGQTQSDGAGSNDLLIAKYNSSGTLQWDKTLGGTETDGARGLTVDSSDNIIVTGWTRSDGEGLDDVLLAKYNSSGTLQWDKTFGGSSYDIGYGVAVDSSDNIIVGGITGADGIGSDGVLLIKYNSSGTLQWAKTYGGIVNERAVDVAVDSSDNIVIVGYTSSDGEGSDDALIAKFNSSGTLQWDRTLGSGTAESAEGVAIDSSDNIILNGRAYNTTNSVYDFMLAKYNSSGTLQWQKTLGGSSGSEYGYGVTINSLDSIIALGWTNSDGAGGTDLLIAKLPSNGSGDGTYGSIVYQDASLTDAEAVLSVSSGSFVDAAAVLTDAAAVLTDASISLTEELFEVTP